MPETTKVTIASPVTATPAHFSGENTNEEAKSPMATPIFQIISIAPVRYAASGSSDQATPRRPDRRPRRRKTNQLQTRPRPVRPAHSGSQAIWL